MNKKIIYSFIAFLSFVLVGATFINIANAQDMTFRERLMQKRMDSGGEGMGGGMMGKMGDMGGRGKNNTTLPSDVIAETVTHEGIERPYYIYIPPALKGKKDISAFFALHGGMGSGIQLVNSLDIRDDADKNNFAVVYPSSDQQTKKWNDGRGSDDEGLDDIGYIKKVIADISAKYGVSQKRLFAAGISSGGMFSQRIACEMPEYFKGVGVISANLAVDAMPLCKSKYPINMAFFMGTDDKLMPFNGGKNDLKFLEKRRDPNSKGVLSYAETQKFWTEQNGCSKTTGKVALPDKADDKTTVTLETVSGCRDNIVLKFYTINGGGHNWPGGKQSSMSLNGITTQDISGNQEMINFFKPLGL